MLKIGVVDDEIGALVGVVRNLVALKHARPSFDIVPVLLSDPEIDTPEQIAAFAEMEKEKLANAGVNVEVWPEIEQLGKLCPVFEDHRARILDHLSRRDVNLILCDSWIGRDTTLHANVSDERLKVAGAILLEAAEGDPRWSDNCWLMTQYQYDVLEPLIEQHEWKSQRFNPLNNEKRRYINKQKLLKHSPGQCSPMLELVVEQGLAINKLKGLSGPAEGAVVYDSFGEMVGRSAPMQRVYRLVRSVAETNATVLVRGESGTGKELVARELHKHSSHRTGSFVAVNCAALPSELIESELFGHEKGAFTGAAARRRGKFELADGGTLFLDEIGDMSANVQAKLLRALEERRIERLGGSESIPVDVRVVSATHRPLEQEIEHGNFRADLFYRLQVVTIEIAPLRERKEDIPALAELFARQAVERHRLPPRTVSPAALRRLMEYSWPGNVRELRNMIERTMILAQGEELSAEDLPDIITGGARDEGPKDAPAAEPVGDRQASGDWSSKSAEEVLELIKSQKLKQPLPKFKAMNDIEFVRLLQLIQDWTRAEFNKLNLNDFFANKYFNMNANSYRQRMGEYKKTYNLK